MLTRDQDFVCDTSQGIILCSPLTPEADSTYKVLQLQLSRLLPQMPGARVKIQVDGIIGPSATLATQMVIARVAQSYPEAQALGPLVYAPAEQAILSVAEYADAISAVIDQILARDPNAVRSPRPLTGPAPEDPIAFVKRIFTKKRLIAGTVAAAGLAGLAIVAGASDARALGRVDRSGFLPESDGSDEFDEGEEIEDDSEVEAVIRPPLALPEASAVALSV